ncbi:transglutaminase family protein [uncultured Pseudacidovorax sp.]|uniref:transglutaminase family protein n=1 Tax=uncultured Pseudacidovorax sp. TaxID=679313 RepID=UPI0025F651AC|nr:transglutaminase family protein [uncultured Pseudacidovorax sp.]
MATFDILHTTTYRYHAPVSFGQHRVMFRPRDSHDLRVLATDLRVSPEAHVRLIQDPHSNSVALVQPRAPAAELTIACAFTIEHVPGPADELQLDPSAEFLPFAYSVQERLDLEHYLRPHHDDPDGTLIRWAHQFLHTDAPNSTRDTLTRMNAHINQSLTYQGREEEGTQTPLETLAIGGGSCRDYALLMMEAARRLGIATRFVSGYLYDPMLDVDPADVDAAVDGDPGEAPGPDDAPATPPEPDVPAGAEAAAPDEAAPAERTVGAGSTHAWLQAYLPGAGWVAFDPTNNLMGSGRLIRVGVARDPAQAPPIAGSWFGDAGAYAGMDVVVKVTRRRD